MLTLRLGGHRWQEFQSAGNHRQQIQCGLVLHRVDDSGALRWRRQDTVTSDCGHEDEPRGTMRMELVEGLSTAPGLFLHQYWPWSPQVCPLSRPQRLGAISSFFSARHCDNCRLCQVRDGNGQRRGSHREAGIDSPRSARIRARPQHAPNE